MERKNRPDEAESTYVRAYLNGESEALGHHVLEVDDFPCHKRKDVRSISNIHVVD